VKREDLKHSSVLLIGRKAFAKPDLSQVESGDRVLVLKDVGQKNLFVRWTLGLWLIHKEWSIYSRLMGIKGIPRVIERIDRFAFTMEFVPGRPVERGESLSFSFFCELERILEEVHAKGVVHLDLRHKGNILISEKGDPVLIDFNSGFYFRNELLRRILFPLLRWVDYGGILKLKHRVASSMTPQELKTLKRLNRLRKFWIFN
jgi:serine/threonine protein kinase